MPVGVGELRHAASGENIVDLADCDHILSGLDNRVKHGLCGRLKREIMAAGRARIRPFALERAGDDAAHAVFADQEAFVRCGSIHKAAQAGRQILMRCDLEHGVRRRVDDQITGLHVLAAIVA